ncbi:unnamed protein product, partial [marine sediment metagenome]
MAKEEKEERAEEEKAEEKKKKKKGSLLKWVIIAVVVLIVAAAGVFGWMYFANKDPGKKGTATAVQQSPSIGTLWEMKPFIVNLMDDRGERYLKVVIVFEVSGEGAVSE